MSFFKKLFGLGNDEPKKEEVQTTAANTYYAPEIEDEEDFVEDIETTDEGENEEELSEEDQKLFEREKRIKEVMEGPKYHAFDEHDKSPQGQKAIQLGIHNNLGGGRATYDYTKVEGADFSWPDYDPSQIGHLEPWLCYGPEEDSGWIDLNEFPNGAERRSRAAFQSLGYLEIDNPKFTYVDQKSIAELERLLSLDDTTLNIEAPKEGMKSNNFYSYRDYVTGMKLDFEKRFKKNNEKAQQVLDVANEMMQEEMNANIEAAKAGGLLDPIKGVSMEDWAAANAKISSGTSLDNILKVLGVEKPIWDEVSAEWMSRMSQDTTFAISKVYGDAFTNPNIGKFASASDGSVTTSDSESVAKAKNDFELYVKIMCHQNMASAQGIDASAILQQYGLTAADWGAVGAHWSAKINSDMTIALKMGDLMEKYNAEFATNTPPKVGDDIDF